MTQPLSFDTRFKHEAIPSKSCLKQQSEGEGRSKRNVHFNSNSRNTPRHAFTRVVKMSDNDKKNTAKEPIKDLHNHVQMYDIEEGSFYDYDDARFEPFTRKALETRSKNHEDDIAALEVVNKVEEAFSKYIDQNDKNSLNLLQVKYSPWTSLNKDQLAERVQDLTNQFADLKALCKRLKTTLTYESDDEKKESLKDLLVALEMHINKKIPKTLNKISDLNEIINREAPSSSWFVLTAICLVGFLVLGLWES